MSSADSIYTKFSLDRFPHYNVLNSQKVLTKETKPWAWSKRKEWKITANAFRQFKEHSGYQKKLASECIQNASSSIPATSVASEKAKPQEGGKTSTVVPLIPVCQAAGTECEMNNDRLGIRTLNSVEFMVYCNQFNDALAIINNTLLLKLSAQIKADLYSMK